MACQLHSCTVKTDPLHSNISRLTHKGVVFNVSKQVCGHIRDNAKHMTNEVKNDKSAEEIFEMEAHKDGMETVILGPYSVSLTFTFRFIPQQTKYCTF